MAESTIARDAQRRVVVARHAERRRELKAVAASPHVTEAERVAARLALARMPRDASATRLRLDVVDGRPRGYLRPFGLSRVRFRAMAHAGELPVITTSSW